MLLKEFEWSYCYVFGLW